LPVIDPLSLRQSHYRHFIQLLRANLSCYGAIRIDHAMSLMRLWWCLTEEGDQQRAGAYVYFHVQDMLALLRLESHRGHCQVIGEDLGVVPREFRELMQANALMGNTLFYFEQDYSHNFRAPHEHREQVALMVTNHDVPTLADWWAKSDIKRRFDLAVIKSEDELTAVCAQRRHEKGQLLYLLGEQQLLSDSWQCRDTEKPFDFELCLAIHRLCARSASRWVLFQLEDLQLMTEPVNIPGTYREYPNWRRKQLRATGDILADSQVVQLLRHISQERIRAQS
jgi:4-alpha-glucanotransferase